MVTCPVCNWVWQLRREEIKRGSFACPGCNERLRLPEPEGAGTMIVGSALLAVLIPYLAGAEGYTFLLAAIIIYVTVPWVATGVRILLFLLSPYPVKLTLDTKWDVGGVLHLSDPPDSPKKP